MPVPVIETRHRLKIARESAGFDRNAQAFAESLGISRQTIVSYERGHSAPDRRTIMAWSMLTNVPMWWLDGKDGPTSPASVGGEGLPRLDSNQQPAGYSIDAGIASLDDKRRRVARVARDRAA